MSQATTSPASSLWNVYHVVSMLGGALHTAGEDLTYYRFSRMAMMDRCVFAALIGNDVDFSHHQPHLKVPEKEGGRRGGI